MLFFRDECQRGGLHVSKERGDEKRKGADTPFRTTETEVKRCEIYRSGVFIVNFESISPLFLVFIMLTLNK